MKNKDQIASLNKKLEQKNNEFSEFIYRTSHDVRGPIATIKGLTNVAKLENKCLELNIYFDLINKVANRLDLILEHLNGISGIGDYSFSEFGIQELIDQIISRLKKLKDLYDLEFQVVKSYSDFDLLIRNNFSQICALIENLLLALTSSRYFYNVKFSIELISKKTGLCLDVVYQNINLIFVSNSIQKILFNEDSGKDSRIGYNDMRINIVNKSIKLTGVSLNVFGKGNKSIIRIFIPAK